MEKYNIEKDKDLYTIAVLRYKEENPNLNFDDMFSMEWNLSKDYHLKTIIIAQAIQNHVLIEDTELYKNNFEKHEEKQYFKDN